MKAIIFFALVAAVIAHNAAAAADNCASPCSISAKGQISTPEPVLAKSSLAKSVARVLPKGTAYYRLTINRDAAASACSAVERGSFQKTYVHVTFQDGVTRVIKPTGVSGGCENSPNNQNSALQMAFRSLDGAQEGIFTCAPNAKTCPVFLYVGTDNSKSDIGRLVPSNRTFITGRMAAEPSFALRYTTCGCGEPYCVCCGNIGQPQPCQNCFPGNAIVHTENSSMKRMSELKIGDKVLATRPDGTIFYDEIYMFGHKDPSFKATFVALKTSSGDVLRLTSDHFLPIVRNGKTFDVASADVNVGDIVRVLDKLNRKESTLEVVTEKSVVFDHGVFNPYTLSGNIIVDGVSASVHSSSGLDSVITALGVSIPVGYQVVFAPVRAIYRLVGPQRFASLEFIIDAVAGVANTNSNNLAGATLSRFATSLGVAGAAWLVMHKRFA